MSFLSVNPLRQITSFANKKNPRTPWITFLKMVGAARVELTTSCSQSKRSTRLSYAPINEATVNDKSGRFVNLAFLRF